MRFVRRDGARVFLDSRDLILLLEKDQPISAAVLADELRRRNARIVLAPTNVTELVPQNEKTPANPSRVAKLMDALERLPHSFIRTPEVGRSEFLSAITAYDQGTAVRVVDPYVDHWWETLWRIPPRIARYILPQEEIQILDSLTVGQQVSMLLGDPALLRFQGRHEENLRQAMVSDRNRFGTIRGSKPALIGAVKRQFEWHGWSEPVKGIEDFVDFLLRHPEACPGWRLGFDVWEEYRCNLTATPTRNDIADFSHVQLLPYVTYATLDRAWRARCGQARERLERLGDDVSVYRRLFPDLAAVIASW